MRSCCAARNRSPAMWAGERGCRRRSAAAISAWRTASDHAPDAPQAQEPGPAHAAADAAAGTTRTRRAWHDRSRRRRPLRAAGVRRLQRRAVPAARSLPSLPASNRLKWREQSGEGELLSQTTLHHSNDLFFRERLPWRLGLVRLDAGATLMAASARRRAATRRHASGRRAAGPRRPGRADRLSRQGDRQHGRRPDAARDDLRPEVPQGAGHRRHVRRGPGAGARRWPRPAPT